MSTATITRNCWWKNSIYVVFFICIQPMSAIMVLPSPVFNKSISADENVMGTRTQLCFLRVPKCWWAQPQCDGQRTCMLLTWVEMGAVWAGVAIRSRVSSILPSRVWTSACNTGKFWIRYNVQHIMVFSWCSIVFKQT